MTLGCSKNPPRSTTSQSRFRFRGNLPWRTSRRSNPLRPHTMMILPRDFGYHNLPPPLQPLTRRPLSISRTLALRYLMHRILHNRCIRIIEKRSRLSIQLHRQRANLLHLSRLAGWIAQWILSRRLHLDPVSQWRSRSRCARCKKARLWNHGSLIIIV